MEIRNYSHDQVSNEEMGTAKIAAMPGKRTTDAAVRRALHAKRLRRAMACPRTLVIDELGLAHAKCRIDVAVINGIIHGYEIKSARDTLRRLSAQIDVFRQTLQRLTIVAAPRHVAGLETQAPEWCGILAAEQGRRGGIRFHVVRNAAASPDVDPIMMAHLLWREEVITLLRRMGYETRELRRPRKDLYAMLCADMTLSDITDSIRGCMMHRRAWRDRPVHA